MKRNAGELAIPSCKDDNPKITASIIELMLIGREFCPIAIQRN